MTSKIPRWQWFHDYFASTEAHLHGFTRLLFQKTTPYQTIEILETPFYGRMLVLDGDVQSSEKDEYIYHEALVHPAMILHPNPSRVLVMGGGEGATLREVLRHRTVLKAEMFDLDLEVIEACKTYLPEWNAGSYQDPRATLHAGDARKMLAQYDGPPFQVIISDLTDPFAEGPSHLLFTGEFFRLVKERMDPDGIFVLQASLLRNVTYEMHLAIRNTLLQVFSQVHSYFAYVPAFDTTWGFILSSDCHDPVSPTLEEIDRRIARRVEGELRYYDGETHLSLFHLPKDIRALLAQPSPLIEDGTPFFLPRKGNE